MNFYCIQIYSICLATMVYMPLQEEFSQGETVNGQVAGKQQLQIKRGETGFLDEQNILPVRTKECFYQQCLLTMEEVYLGLLCEAK